MLTFHDLGRAFRKLGVPRTAPVIAHASLRAFGPVQGGAGTVVEALLSVFGSLVMPVFTYKTMLIPEAGPPGNAIDYGTGASANRMAVFFEPDLPADRMMGKVPEALRLRTQARRSMHPIMSFAGVNASRFLESQSLAEPLGPIQRMADEGGWVLLLGVDHTTNTSIHWAESLAGRRGFIRWALTPQGVVECPGFPGCSNGFNAIEPRLHGRLRKTRAGQALVQAVPLQDLSEAAANMLRADRGALLCANPTCSRCQATRERARG